MFDFPFIQKNIDPQPIIDEAIEHIIEIEGGYVNDPQDSGGETKYGVTVKIARAQGYEGPMKKLGRKKAKTIIWETFWVPLKLDKVVQVANEELAKDLLEMSVHIGPRRAVFFLQDSLNLLMLEDAGFVPLHTDGRFGDDTLKALLIYCKRNKIRKLKELSRYLDLMQASYYFELVRKAPKNRKFLKGWLKKRIKT